MPTALAQHHTALVRPARVSDLDALVALENEVFSTDRISRRSFRRFLASRNAALVVAEIDGRLAGYALVLFRSSTGVARLYSIAVAPQVGGRRVGTTLLKAAEDAALERGAARLRLEVREANDAAVGLYRKLGYRQFGRHAHYYEDRGHALRFEKRLSPDLRRADPPPYFHQTTEFTCGPACMMMALAWADPSFRPSPALEFKLWREATTIFMTSGPGGCDPYGVAVTLKRHGLEPEIHASHGGPYFLDKVRSADKRRVMRLAQEEFRREAKALKIPIHLAPLDESALMETFEKGAVVIVLVSGYRMVRRNVPHWVFAFGREGHYVLVHDPAAMRDEHGNSTAPETYAVPASEFDRMTRFGPDDLRAAILIRKGRFQ
ncbi:MAG TPA: ribosomal protein S18-alanine N-acetyltransferase [Xanthobacteraceae bacterium]|nr:ribosomal protein S18-alanine N-acetyltransferase [Xanthobacteraceae bacterium]